MAQSNKPRLLAIVGPTASGKSALAVAAAKALGGEIISCDSMQVYRRMNIGTAKPTAEEMGGVKHHLIDVVAPDAPFSVAEYVPMAQAAAEEIFLRGRMPILCGGTGLYLDAFLRGGMEDTASDPALRRSLFAYAEAHGARALHERLAAVDPESAAATHENNVKRVVRALEIFESTGVTKTELDRRSRQIEAPYEVTVIGLRYAARELLYARIEQRVDQMLADGLLSETKALLEEGVFEANTTAAQAIGYKELLGYLRGEQSLAEATEALKTATRRYAKRQMTWFGAKDYIQWIDMEREGILRPTEEILTELLQFASEKQT